MRAEFCARMVRVSFCWRTLCPVDQNPVITPIGQLTLLQTKLQRPRVTADLVDRPRLTQALNDGLDHPLILVAAPAGMLSHSHRAKTAHAKSPVTTLLRRPALDPWPS